MMYNVKDMYEYTSDNSVKLLSDFSADFWSDYKTNYTYFDRLFKRFYKSYLFFEQEDDDDATVQEVQQDFTNAVYEWLLLNNKRYSELYRINTADDTKFNIYNNVDLTEENEHGYEKENESIYGQRTDVNDYQLGEQHFSGLDKNTPHNSNNENSFTSDESYNGTRNDITQFTKGQENDNSGEVLNGSYETHKYGNNGNILPVEIMNKHNSFWDKYCFYRFIFDEIAEQFLRLP